MKSFVLCGVLTIAAFGVCGENKPLSVEDQLKKIEADLPNLIKILESNDFIGRHQALMQISQIASKAKRAEPQIINVYRDRDPIARDLAARILGDIRPVSKETIEVLVAGMKDKLPGAAQVALYALGRIGPDAKPAVAELIAFIKNEAVSQEVGTALGLIGGAEVLPQIVPLLEDASPKVRCGALRALQSIGAPAASATPKVIALAEDKDKGVFSIAMDVLFQIGRDDKATTALLQKILKDGDIQRKSRAIQFLKMTGNSASGAIDELIGVLACDDENVANDAAAMLGGFGEKALQPLTAAAQSDNPILRRRAYYGLGVTKLPAAVSALTEALADKEEFGRLAAAYALSLFAPTKIPDAVTALTKLLKDDSENVRAQAVVTIEKVALSKELLPQLIEVLDTKSQKTRENVVHALQQLGAQATPELLQILKDVDPARRVAVLQVFRNPAFESTVPELLKCLSDKSPEVRASAIYALEIFPKAEGLNEALEKLKLDINPIVRNAAIRAQIVVQKAKDGETPK